MTRAELLRALAPFPDDAQLTYAVGNPDNKDVHPISFVAGVNDENEILLTGPWWLPQESQQ